MAAVVMALACWPALRAHAETSELQACYDEAARSEPDLTVDTVAMLLLRGDQAVFVDIELPDRPDLVACFSAALMRSKVDIRIKPDSYGTGGKALRFGPNADGPRPTSNVDAVLARIHRFDKRVLESGLVPPSAALYKELHAHE
jgi:hypothetical protein